MKASQGLRNPFPYFQAFDQKLLLQNIPHFYQEVQNWLSKQELELSKEEIELFLQIPGFLSKTSFMKYYSFFPGLHSKTAFTKYFLFLPRGLQYCFSKQDMKFYKREMELFLPLPGLWSNNFFYNIISISTKEF